jgi:hypothetical protein
VGRRRFNGQAPRTLGAEPSGLTAARPASLDPYGKARRLPIRYDRKDLFMFTVCSSPKGGQGCTTVTAALAVIEPDALVIDVGGDLPALLGLPEPAGLGVCDLLADTQPIDLAALDTITVTTDTIRLVPAGQTPASEVRAGRWTELANVVARQRRTVFLDAGTNTVAASVPADRRLLMVRACSLALRRAIALPVRSD